MPDKVRSVDDMVVDMEKAVEEPEGNTSSGKHRQHVAQAIEKLISSQIIDGKLRYIEDGTGSKAATKTAPTLLTLAAAVQEMVSEMSGRKMSYTITIEGKDAAAAAPKPTTTGKPRGRPPKDPAKKAAEAEQKKKDDHKKAISEFDKVYDERQKYLDAGIGDEFAGWETTVKRLRDEQNKLDATRTHPHASGARPAVTKKVSRSAIGGGAACCRTFRSGGARRRRRSARSRCRRAPRCRGRG